MGEFKAENQWPRATSPLGPQTAVPPPLLLCELGSRETQRGGRPVHRSAHGNSAPGSTHASAKGKNATRTREMYTVK